MTRSCARSSPSCWPSRASRGSRPRPRSRPGSPRSASARTPRPPAPSSLVSVHRADDATATDYYFLYNQGCDVIDTRDVARSNVFEDPAACRTAATVVNRCVGGRRRRSTSTVTLKGTGTPYELDTDRGEITPIAQYTTGAGTVTVRVNARRATSRRSSRSPGSRGRFGAAPPTARRRAPRPTGRVARQPARRPRHPARAPTPRRCPTAGRRPATIAAVPAAIDLTGATWHLAAEDWQPANPLGTAGQAGSAITQGPGQPDAQRAQGVAGHPGARERVRRRHLHHDGHAAAAAGSRARARSCASARSWTRSG